jgi:hypothetical protein
MVRKCYVLILAKTVRAIHIGWFFNRLIRSPWLECSERELLFTNKCIDTLLANTTKQVCNTNGSMYVLHVVVALNVIQIVECRSDGKIHLYGYIYQCMSQLLWCKIMITTVTFLTHPFYRYLKRDVFVYINILLGKFLNQSKVVVLTFNLFF